MADADTGSEMKVYIHDDRSEPTFMIPIAPSLWLVWIKRDNGPSEWSIKNLEYIKSMKQKYPDKTCAEIGEASPMLQEATGLEVFVHSANSIEEVRDIYIEHKRVLASEEELSEN